MNSPKGSERIYQERVYNALEIAAFRKTAEVFGGLSNMAPGYPINVNGIAIFNTEALYQACRFPHMPEVQAKILREKSPMTAKMVSKPFRNQSRADFEQVKVDVMRWCLRIKLAQNFTNFGRLLESTGNLFIVEDSHKDAFWGAMRSKLEPNVLKGVNALGRLLMELRQQYVDNRYSCKIFQIHPLQIPDFKILGQEIGVIDECSNFLNYITKQFCINNEQIIVNDQKFIVNQDYLHVQASNTNNFTLQIEEPKSALPKSKKRPAKTLSVKEVVRKSNIVEAKSRVKATPKAKAAKPLPLFNA